MLQEVVSFLTVDGLVNEQDALESLELLLGEDRAMLDELMAFVGHDRYKAEAYFTFIELHSSKIRSAIVSGQ